MSKKLIVAIDGPAGSGKSTSAKLVAQRLGYLYIDTGAMYRAVTFLSIEKNILDSAEAIVQLSEQTEIELRFLNGQTNVLINDRDITNDIRSTYVNSNVSYVSKIQGVRTAMVKKQREMGLKNGGVVMEGRDIGTVVFPEADVKVFLTASIDERAKRRAKEYEDNGTHVAVDDIKSNLIKRDNLDSTREISPLIKAPDAFEVDTSNITIERQVEIILERVEQVAKSKGVQVHLN